MRCLFVVLLLLLIGSVSCDLATDTKDEAVSTSEGAVGIAEKMSGGTVGDTDENTGESPDAEDDVQNMADEITGE